MRLFLLYVAMFFAVLFCAAIGYFSHHFFLTSDLVRDVTFVTLSFSLVAAVIPLLGIAFLYLVFYRASVPDFNAGVYALFSRVLSFVMKGIEGDEAEIRLKFVRNSGLSRNTFTVLVESGKQDAPSDESR